VQSGRHAQHEAVQQAFIKARKALLQNI
jgi:hypothetical protein